MRIYNSDLAGAAAAGSSRAQETQLPGRASGSPGTSGSSEGGDRVEFSAGLGQLARAVSSYGADRASRVEALTVLYQSGGYQANPAQTSRAMIAEAVSGTRVG